MNVLQSDRSLAPTLSAFDALRAEDEPWLADCFVPPPDFGLIAGTRSVLVFGESGSGKTALYRMLLRRLRPPDRKPSRLVVEWQPAPLPPYVLADSDAAEAMLDHVLAACVDELLRHIVSRSDEFDSAPQDMKNTLAWFAREYQVVVESASDLLPVPTDDDFLDQAEPQQRIAELLKVLDEIEMSGVYILVGPDNLGNYDAIQPGLSALLSSLNLFEQSRFVYKLILPATLGRSLLSTGGIERRRLDPISLRWLDLELLAVVERRLELATGGKASRLGDVCEDEKLAEWLARYGGDVPVGWLEQARSLVTYYLSRGRKLTTQEWEQIRKSRPPRLSVDLETGRITVGRREIENIGQVEMVFLRYLYQHRGDICTREELYHKAYVPSLYPELVGEHAYPKEYGGMLDTALWRLRQAIEPNPKRPVFVITKRGKGVVLENAW